MRKNPVSTEEIVAAIKGFAEKMGRAPSLPELQREYGHHLTRALIGNRYGSYTRALEACGLKRQDRGRPRTDMELFEAWATAARRLGRAPSMGEMFSEAHIFPHCYMRRWGKWSTLREAMAEFMRQAKLEAEWPDVVELIRKRSPRQMLRIAQVRPGEATGSTTLPAIALERPVSDAQTANATAQATLNTTAEPILETTAQPILHTTAEPTLTTTAQPIIIPGVPGESAALAGNPLLMPATLMPGLLIQNERPVYGEPINHRCMANAPTNEDGVLGLFVAMARDLDFIVTRIQRAFPDIEALRKGKDGRWRLTLAELEYESLGFVKHGHDPRGCDLLICWIHNWKECPVEVIELRRLFQIG